MTEKGFIYIAAGLFNGNTNLFNAYITDHIEQAGFRAYLPQRDGFEVAKFIAFLRAAKSVFDQQDPAIATNIGRYVPYYLDLGHFMSRSIAVVANLDDPLDSGMVVEIAYAKMCNLPVIGVRTDLRSPLGEVEDTIGINPFPVEQCDCFIKAYPPTGGYETVIERTDAILAKVNEKLTEWIPRKKNNMRDPNNSNPIFQDIVKGADILFGNLEGDLHSKENMIEIAKRFAANQKLLLGIAPELVSITETDEESKPD